MLQKDLGKLQSLEFESKEKDKRIEFLEEKLAEKNEQLGEYRENIKNLSSKSEWSIEELLEQYSDIKDIANSHAEEEKLKREFIKNFKNDYRIVEK